MGFVIALALLVLSIVGLAWVHLSPLQSIKSRLYASDAVENADRYQTADTRYYPQHIFIEGRWKPALFTRDQLKVAMQRAEGNGEDVPPRRPSWLMWLPGAE